MPSDTELATLRVQLEDERASLRRQLEELEGDTAVGYDENFADSGQVAAEQGEAKVLLRSLSDQLREVERALAKFDEGAYGLCERCSRPISEARLEAMPATRYCIDHA